MKHLKLRLSGEAQADLLPYLRKYPASRLIGIIKRDFGHDYHVEIIVVNPMQAAIARTMLEFDELPAEEDSSKVSRP